jgi:hypothetical protein
MCDIGPDQLVSGAVSRFPLAAGHHAFGVVKCDEVIKWDAGSSLSPLEALRRVRLRLWDKKRVYEL